MKIKKIIAKTISIFTLLSIFLAVPAIAFESSTIDSRINGILHYNLKESDCSNVQEWIDTCLSGNPASGAEWYVMALSQDSAYNFKKYRDSLINYLNNNSVNSAVSKQKYALTLVSIGERGENISAIVDDTVGRQGIMSWIFGLHILNNGIVSEKWDIDSVTERLLALQLSDGGWAVTGNYADVDTTAMAIQALAFQYGIKEEVKISVDRAVNLLSSLQLDNGLYKSYGVVNPESSAQVLTALSSLKIDCLNDIRFIKSGNDLINSIDNFKLPNNSFSHTLNGQYNGMSTSQVFCSAKAYSDFLNGGDGFYIFNQEVPPENNYPEKTDVKCNSTRAKLTYKFWTILSISVIAIIFSFILFAFKKRNIKSYILIAVISAISILTVLFTNIQSVDEFYSNTLFKENPIGTVTISIDCGKVCNEGKILNSKEYQIEKGTTVYDILKEAVSENKIQMEVSGPKDSIYVQGINYIYEFDFGKFSGWVYHVNGESPSVSCSSYELKDGDKIEWLYSTELGKDVD